MPWARNGMWLRCRLDEVSVPTEERRSGPSHEPGSRSWGLVQLEGDLVLSCGLCHQGVQCVSVAQAG